MTRLSIESILHVPVYTHAGTFLGRIVDVTLETESQQVLQYAVKQKGLGILKTPLLIHRDQVISLSEEKMVVEDNLLQDAVPEIKAI